MQERLRRYRSNLDLTACGQVVGDTYYSRWYTGLRADMEWLRLTLDMDDDAYVCVYTCNSINDVCETASPVMVRTARDLLLYGVRGKYLRFTVTPYDSIHSYELTFPANSITNLLPMVLRQDETLRQLLGVLQSLYMDTNREMREFHTRLDPMSPNPLPILSSWLGIPQAMHEKACHKRLLCNAPFLTRLRGTRKGLKLLLDSLGIHNVTTIESSCWHNTVKSASEKADCTRLYGGSNSIALILPSDTQNEAIALLPELLKDFIPLGVGVKLIKLKDGAPLDEHSYLDMNVQLTETEPSCIDEAILGTLTLE